MKILDRTYSGPDTDGDVSFTVTAIKENNYKDDIQLIKISTLVLDSDGYCINGSSDDDVETFISTSDQEKFEIYVPSVKYDFAAAPPKILVEANYYRRQFIKLGNFKIPEESGKSVRIEKNSIVSDDVQIFGGTIYKNKPDNEGDITVEVSFGVKNISEKYIARGELKMTIIDNEGCEIMNSDNYLPLPPNSVITIELYECGKKNRFNDCEIKLGLNVFIPIGHDSTEVIVEK
jgi:hypothetical protein